MADFVPASTSMAQAWGSFACRVAIDNRATEPIDGKASPRKPSVRIDTRSSSASFDVAWRSTASARSARLMPSPSSVTRMRRRPPPSVSTSIRRAPASSAFSTSSLTTLAGRSTTSPAAMRLTMASESWRTGMGDSGWPVTVARIGAWRNPGRSIERRLGAAQILDAAAAFLAFDAALARRFGRPGRPPLDRRDGGLADQADQAVERILPIAPLGAVALRDDDQHAVAGQPRAGEPLQSGAHVVGQRRRVPHVEAKLHRGRELVDVLPARPRRAHEAFFDFALVDRDAVGDVNHGAAS